MAKEEDQLLGSNYDGIEEYDNDLPRWWLYLFYLTIAFSAFYIPYYHFGPGQTDQPIPHLERQMVAHNELVKSAEEEIAKSGAEAAVSLETAVSDASRIASGKEIYVAKCAACHGQQGEGLVGPNLTDNAWIHGGTKEDILRIIQNGVIEKGMLAWKGVLKQDEMVNTTAYLWSIRNTNVPGKPAQGDVVE